MSTPQIAETPNARRTSGLISLTLPEAGEDARLRQIIDEVVEGRPLIGTEEVAPLLGTNGQGVRDRIRRGTLPLRAVRTGTDPRSKVLVVADDLYRLFGIDPEAPQG